jgi:hypothetical protein
LPVVAYDAGAQDGTRVGEYVGMRDGIIEGGDDGALVGTCNNPLAIFGSSFVALSQ